MSHRQRKKEILTTTRLLTVKGAPEILLDRVGYYVNSNGVTKPLGKETREEIEAVKNQWASKGRRVLLLARKVVSGSVFSGPLSEVARESKMNDEARSGLTLVGLVGIVDPPRPEIPSVVNTLRRAGIRVFMVRHHQLAQAIATECGIITTDRIDTVEALGHVSTDSPSTCEMESGLTLDSPRGAIVLSGGELITLSEDQWCRLASYEEIVFARTTPEQKLRIVREFQSRGERVGMTGDGVNDAPSLRAANIGIAMGSGSDIAIEAADMVLLDSFSSVVEAVRYGRVMYDNLKKTIAYLLPAGSFSEFWPVMTNVCFGMPQILSSFPSVLLVSSLMLRPQSLSHTRSPRPMCFSESPVSRERTDWLIGGLFCTPMVWSGCWRRRHRLPCRTGIWNGAESRFRKSGSRSGSLMASTRTITSGS